MFDHSILLLLFFLFLYTRLAHKFSPASINAGTVATYNAELIAFLRFSSFMIRIGYVAIANFDVRNWYSTKSRTNPAWPSYLA